MAAEKDECRSFSDFRLGASVLELKWIRNCFFCRIITMPIRIMRWSALKDLRLKDRSIWIAEGGSSDGDLMRGAFMYKNYKWYHLVLFLLGFLSLVAVTIYFISMYGKIDSEVPTHFNAIGEADVFGSKSSLIVSLIIGWVLFVGMLVVGAIPAVWNTGVKITEENQEKIHSIIRTMLSILTFAIAAFTSCTVFFAVKGMNLPAVILPVFLIVIFGTIIISVIHLVRKR